MKLYKLKLTEEELVSKLKKRDKTAFSALYDSYSDALYGIILKIVRTDPPAEDVMQEAFVKIWRKIDDFNPEKGTIFTWMLNISRNTGIDTTRSENYKKSAAAYDVVENTKKIDAFRNETYKTDHIGVKEIVERLKPEHKEIIDLIYFNGFTQSEVAEHLQMPLGTVKTRVKLAMNHLRETFAD
ncbi:MAG: RNA polymerase sigma factor [Cytophagales bacterium]